MKAIFRNLCGGLTKRGIRHVRGRTAERARLQVEPLEDRLAQSGMSTAGLAAAAATPEFTLELTPRSGAAITLTLNSFQFARGGADKLSVMTPVSAAVSDLLHDAESGIGFKSAVLVESVPASHATFTWNLGNVFVASESVTVGSHGALPVETLDLVFASETVTYRP